MSLMRCGTGRIGVDLVEHVLRRDLADAGVAVFFVKPCERLLCLAAEGVDGAMLKDASRFSCFRCLKSRLNGVLM